MGFRHRRSFKIAPGVRINVGKKSASVTFGGKHTPHYTVNSKGRKTVSTKTPVKGVSYSKSWSSSSNSRKHNKSKSNYSSSKSSNSYYNNNNNYNETETGSSMTIIDRVDAMRHNAKYRINKLNTWSKNHKIGSAIFLVVVAMISASLYGNVINPKDSNDESCTNAICTETTEEVTTRASLTRVEKETTTTTKESTTEEETTARRQETTNTTTPAIPEAPSTTSVPSTTAAPTTSTPTTEAPSTTSVPSTTATPTTSAPTTEAPSTSAPTTEAPTTEKSETVYITPSGSKYHSRKCGNGNYSPIEKSEAIAAGYEPCRKCY